MLVSEIYSVFPELIFSQKVFIKYLIYYLTKVKNKSSIQNKAYGSWLEKSISVFWAMENVQI